MTPEPLHAGPTREDNDAPIRGETTSDRREFMELAAKTGVGALGLGALLALGRDAGALAQEPRPAPEQELRPRQAPLLHNRALNRETIGCLQQLGAELIAYTYGVEATSERAKAITSILKCGTKNGTTCTTCCHPD